MEVSQHKKYRNQKENKLDIQSLIEPLRIEGIITAIICGVIVGLERQLSGKPTWIRTCSLICLGTYVFVAVNQLLLGTSIDPGRIVGQVITGIGFIGAGVILTRQGIVVGITSAAVIWLLAGIGVLIGFGKYFSSVFLSIITVAILLSMNFLEKTFITLRRGVHATMEKYRKREDDNV
jgi:putative Mg2+ transporter-C (MgtC) family protein